MWHYCVKTCGVLEEQIYVRLPSALDLGEWSLLRPDSLTAGKIASYTQWIAGWIGHRVWMLWSKEILLLLPESNRYLLVFQR